MDLFFEYAPPPDVEGALANKKQIGKDHKDARKGPMPEKRGEWNRLFIH